MVDSVKRRLRDGVVENELPPAVMLRDTVTTTGGPLLLKHFLHSVCDNVCRGLSQAKGLVFVSLSESPESYTNFLRQADLTDFQGGIPPTWFRLLDCYTDPLGWEGVSTGADSHSSPLVYRNVRNLEGLVSGILALGKAAVQSSRCTDRFIIFIDSVSVLLRYHGMTAVPLLLQVLRTCDQVAGVCWLVHGDLHDPRIVKGFEYNSSTTIAVEPSAGAESDRGEGGRLTIRQKRRNGRVRESVERFCYTEGWSLSFGPLEKVEPLESGGGQAPKVQFNLFLTESELEDRSKVILPFEHQGNGQEGKIYDGRANIKMSYLASKAQDISISHVADSNRVRAPGGREDLEGPQFTPEAREEVSADFRPEPAALGPGFGEIHYLRDSDDERPDSDEDPDDDLDI